MSGSGLSCQYNGSLDIPRLYSSSMEYWRRVEVAIYRGGGGGGGGVSRDAVHIHAKIVSTRNREISILGDVQPNLG